MSKVDLSKAKKGDKVKFRCGGEAVIKAAYKNNEFEYGFSFEGDDGTPTLYHRNANPDGKGIGPHPFQIIAIEPAPFDWSTVKAGMAFMPSNGSVHGPVYYVGISINENSLGVCNPIFEWKDGPIFSSHRDNYMRTPEHDIEVQL